MAVWSRSSVDSSVLGMWPGPQAPMQALGRPPGRESMYARRHVRPSPSQKLTERLRAADGFALPTTLLMLIMAFAIVSVGVASTVDVQRGTNRDQSTKSAVQLAETGVSQAMLHFNRIAPSPTNACSPVSGGVASGGWCPAVTATDPNGGSYTYQARICDAAGACPPAAGKAPYSVEVVGTGTSGDSTRRVDVRGHSVSGVSPFGTYQVKAGDWITLDSNARIHAGTATNGDIILSSNAKQCGQASVGVGHQLQQAGSNSYFQDPNCTVPNSTVQQQQIFLPPVNQGDVVVNNNDANFFARDIASGNKASACWSGRNASGTTGSCGTRHLDVGTNSTVTMTGSKYSFCKLTMSSNSSLLVAAGQTAAIYFDSPESCGYSSGTVQLDMASNTRITSNGGGKADVQLLFVGSTTRQTLVNMASNTDQNAACEQNFIVYAPLSDVTIKGSSSIQGSTYCGAVAGNTIHVQSNVSLVSGRFDLAIQPPVPYYQGTRFVECRAAAA